MKLPSIFRTATPMRFDIKPRYYDPIREEIEERTSRIKRELEEEGLLKREGEGAIQQKGLGSGIRGSFAQQRGYKSKTSSTFSSSAVIRTLLFFVMIIGTFGYIYVGPEILNYLLYGAILCGGVYFVFRFLKRSKDD